LAYTLRASKRKRKKGIARTEGENDSSANDWNSWNSYDCVRINFKTAKIFGKSLSVFSFIIEHKKEKRREGVVRCCWCVCVCR
jgi:hypothetical protein